ncbi:MAG: DUF2513 domain-containing protein [Cyanobacteria bacterium]|nr:DUF2513 domain-containing protein [Cyanobacteriota bacterium]
MKRDLELFKKILIQVEELPIGQILDSSKNIEGYEQEIVAEHVRLLEEANFIEAQISMGYLNGVAVARRYSITRLLNDGHDFVANAKNPAIWKKTIDFLSKKGGDVSLAVFKGVLAKMTCDYLGL